MANRRRTAAGQSLGRSDCLGVKSAPYKRRADFRACKDLPMADFDFAARVRPWSTARCGPPTSPTCAIQTPCAAVPREALPAAGQGLSGLCRHRGGVRARPLAAAAARRGQAAAGGAAACRARRALAIAAPYAAAVLEALGLTRDPAATRAIWPRSAAGHYDVVVCEGAVSETRPRPGSRRWPRTAGWRGGAPRANRGASALSARSGWHGLAGAVFDAAPPILAGYEAKGGFVF